MSTTNGKYDVRFCKCGRIHFIDNKSLCNALEHDKNYVLICAGCGHAMVIGANIEPDWFDPNKTCYMMYSGDFSEYKNRTIIPSDFESTDGRKGIEEVLYSHGYKVPMMSGMYATDFDHANGIFSDRWYPDFWKIQRSDITVKEIMNFIDEYTYDRTTVDMKRFIRETPDEALDVISRFYIKGLDWKGTKWETEWNSRGDLNA